MPNVRSQLSNFRARDAKEKSNCAFTGTIFELLLLQLSALHGTGSVLTSYCDSSDSGLPIPATDSDRAAMLRA